MRERLNGRADPSPDAAIVGRYPAPAKAASREPISGSATASLCAAMRLVRHEHASKLFWISRRALIVLLRGRQPQAGDDVARSVRAGARAHGHDAAVRPDRRPADDRRHLGGVALVERATGGEPHAGRSDGGADARRPAPTARLDAVELRPQRAPHASTSARRRANCSSMAAEPRLADSD